MKKLSIALVLILAAGLVQTAAALTIQLSTEFSGGTSPSGSPPWVTVVATDVAGGVNLTLTNSNLTGREFVSEIYLNLTSSLLGTLSFTNPVKTGTFALPTISSSSGPTEFPADGGGYFDLRIAFATDDVNRFGAGEALSYLVTSSGSGFNANSFNLQSEPGGGNGTWTAAAHVQAIGANDGSGWIGGNATGVPDAGPTVSLLGLALVGLGLLGRRHLPAGRAKAPFSAALVAGWEW
jgi:hypothetical protein